MKKRASNEIEMEEDPSSYYSFSKVMNYGSTADTSSSNIYSSGHEQAPAYEVISVSAK